MVDLAITPAVTAPWQNPYHLPLPISGGVPPYQLSLAGGSLPTGLSLDVPGQQIAGSATTAGQTTRALFLVTDAAGNFDVEEVEFTVDATLSSPPGDYAAWKSLYGVLNDDESTDNDPWPALVEYFFGYDPTQLEPGGALTLQRLGSPPGFPDQSLYFVSHPERGVPDACPTHQVMDLDTFGWLPAHTNPIPWPKDDPFILRLRVEPK